MTTSNFKGISDTIARINGMARYVAKAVIQHGKHLIVEMAVADEILRAFAGLGMHSERLTEGHRFPGMVPAGYIGHDFAFV